MRLDSTTAHELFQQQTGLDVEDDGYCERFDEWYAELRHDAACDYAESHGIEA